MPFTYEAAMGVCRSLFALHKEDTESFNAGLAAFYLARELGVENPEENIMDTSAHDNLLVRLGERIMNVCYSTDDARFTAYDLADAIAHYPCEFNMEKMTELSDEDFETLVLYMAQCKRNTYSSDCMDDVGKAEDILASIKL